MYSRPLRSIVAVHGLNGDPKDTWTSQQSNAFWLKDFLPHDVPNARVMTFGYNADVAFGKTTAEIVDHAKGLLSSLVDRREENNVRYQYLLGPRDASAELLPRSCEDLSYSSGIRLAE